MDLSIVIVNWNTKERIKQCLASIYAYAPSCEFEILVVDNASRDGSPEMVQENFPSVRLIANRTNTGFARANNQAIRQSKGRYVLLLNPDTRVKPGAFDHLIRYLDMTTDAGAAGGRILNPDGSLQVSCYPRPTLFREFWRMFHLDVIKPIAAYPMDWWYQDKPRRVDVLLGACLITRKEVIENVGMMDEDYFVYSEEVDLCYRIQKAGWNLYWVPGAEIIHFGAQSTRQVAEEMFLRLYQGKVLYFRKHRSRIVVWVYKTILLSATVGRLMISPFAYLEKSPKRDDLLTLASYYRRLLFSLSEF